MTLLGAVEAEPLFRDGVFSRAATELVAGLHACGDGFVCYFRFFFVATGLLPLSLYLEGASRPR